MVGQDLLFIRCLCLCPAGDMDRHCLCVLFNEKPHNIPFSHPFSFSVCVLMMDSFMDKSYS